MLDNREDIFSKCDVNLGETTKILDKLYDFTSLACRCMMEGKISRGAFAEYLEIDRAEIDDYLVVVGFGEESYAKTAAA